MNTSFFLVFLAIALIPIEIILLRRETVSRIIITVIAFVVQLASVATLCILHA